MSNALRNAIQQMAVEFATGVLNAIKGASLEDILAETQRAGGGHALGLTGGRAGARVGLRPTGPAGAGGAKRPANKPGRLGRRSPADIARVVGQIVSLLEAHPRGLRAEQIRDALDVQAKELPRPIAEALQAKRITKVGEKRATTYFAGAGRGRVVAPKPAGAKGKRKGKAKTEGRRAAAPKRAAKRRTAATGGAPAGAEGTAT